MSYLAEQIERLLEKTHQSVDDVAARCGINRSIIYLWKQGKQTSISEEQLLALSPALSSELSDHAKLVEAHLHDEKFGPGSDLVEISIRSEQQLEDRPRPRSPGDKAMAFLAQERISNRDLNDLLIDLARVLGWDAQAQAEPVPTRTSSYPPHKSTASTMNEPVKTPKKKRNRSKSRFEEVEDEPAGSGGSK